MADHGALAEELFRQGYNCSQSVLLAFSDVTGLDRATAARLSSSFGGGFGRMREMCGTVSGAGMVLGLVLGYSDPADVEAKREHYRLIQEFCRRFKGRNGSVVCRDLLKGVEVSLSKGALSITAKDPVLCLHVSRLR